MIYYIYDGSFDGLLTCIYHAFYSDEKPEEIVSEDAFIPNFLAQKMFIETDGIKAKRVYEAIEKKISPSSLKRVFYAYLSELPGSGMAVLKYLQIGFKLGEDVDLNLANEDVLNIEQISRKVGRERHRVIGLLRFEKLKEDILYAKIAPDYNVIALTVPHFKSRLGGENFIIHDTKRGIGAFSNRKEWIVRDIKTRDPFKVHESEEGYQDLWKIYFNSVTIKSKTNPKLQKRNMPMRYWKYLTEKI